MAWIIRRTINNFLKNTKGGTLMLNNKVYDILKYIALIVLPALATLYFAISSIWGLPYGEQIVGTITAVDCFLGALLGISTNLYNKAQQPVKEAGKQ